MKTLRLLQAVLTIIIAASTVQAQEQERPEQLDYKGEPFTYMPKFGFVIRARGAYSFEHDGVNFNVRNARASVSGMAASFLSYRGEVDFCDNGKFGGVTDVYLRGHIGKQLSITAGRQRDPFGVDVVLGPATQWFANRSFVGKQMANLRDLGVAAFYTHPSVPLTAEVGVFNGSGNTIVWHGQPLASARLSYQMGDFKASASFRSYSPDSVRTNSLDAALIWRHDRFHAEAEYIYQHYTKHAFPNAHSANVFATYTLPLRSRIASALTFGARFDYMSDHSSSIRDDEGRLIVNDPERCRLTVGASVARFDKVNARLRLNFEKYFATHGVELPGGEGDNVLLELVVFM